MSLLFSLKQIIQFWQKRVFLLEEAEWRVTFEGEYFLLVSFLIQLNEIFNSNSFLFYCITLIICLPYKKLKNWLIPVTLNMNIDKIKHKVLYIYIYELNVTLWSVDETIIRATSRQIVLTVDVTRLSSWSIHRRSSRTQFHSVWHTRRWINWSSGPLQQKS